MKSKIYILFFLLLWNCASFAQTQKFPFLNFNEKDGFPAKFVYSTTQDKEGFIWLATNNGLYRYDGYEFKIFSSNLDKPDHQINNILQNVYLDVDGNLWLSSLNALQKFNTKTNTFSVFNYENATIEKLVKSKVTSFFESSNGTFWITTKDNFWCKFDEKTLQTNFFNPKDFTTKKAIKIVEISKSEFWIIGQNDLYKFNPISNEIETFKNTKKENEFFDGFYDAKMNCIWLASGLNGITKFDLITKSFVQKNIVDKSINKGNALYVFSIISKNETEIYFGGAFFGVFDKHSEKVQTVSSEYEDDYSFRTNDIHHFNYDNEGNLLIGSYFGFSILPWQNNQIQSIPLINPKNQYTIEPLGTVALNNGDLLIANDTSNGLLYWNSVTKKTEIIEIPFYKNDFTVFSGIWSVHKTILGKIYASDQNGLYQFDSQNKKLIYLNLNDQNNSKVKEIDKIISDKNGNLYLTSNYKGFYFYNTILNEVRYYKLEDVDKDWAKNNSSKLLSANYCDAQNNIWFTYTNGVYCLKNSNKTFVKYAIGKSINKNSKINQSLDFVQDKSGHYWIATADSGLFELFFENGKERLYNYTKEDASGLPTDYCYRLVCDKNGYVWIATLSGLVKFDPSAKKVMTILTRQNGLIKTSVDVALNILDDNRIVVNNYSGLSIINLNSYKYNNNKPKLVFTSVKVLDNEINLTNFKNEIDLKQNQNFIQLQWSALTLNNNNQILYYYKLEGVNKDWIATKKHAISFSGLPDGNYNFKIKAKNNDSVWSDEKSIVIKIIPPVWKTWWFYVLLSIIILGMFFWYNKFKINQVKKEEKIKSAFSQKIAEIEMKALRSQMNPHFIFNSLNSIQKYILKNDTFAASQYLTKFSKLIRLILDHSNQNYITLESEIELLKLYIEIEDLRFDNQFDYDVQVDENLETATFLIPSMIIQPYVENAIWHGLLHKESKGKLILSFTKSSENCIKVSIEDNGIGREKATELKSKQLLKKKSFGMQITQDRISILNQTEDKATICTIIDLKDEKNNAIGTRIELIIPIKKATYDNSSTN